MTRMSALTVSVFIALVILFIFLLTPPRYPRQIPSVPFWITLLPLFFEIDQQQIFSQYIAGPLYKHGAIKIFFGGQWNVIVQRPTYISEVFKKEHIYNKSGNQKKIPHSMLAEFLGERSICPTLKSPAETANYDLVAGSNIISARDEEWRCYRAVIKPGLQTFSHPKPILENAKKLSNIFWQLQGQCTEKGILIQDVLQRYASANLLCCIFDCSELSSQMMSIEHEVPLHTTQLTLKRYLFRPIFMSFPALDRLASVIPSRVKARKLIRQFSDLLQSQILNNRTREGERSAKNNCLGDRLISAWRDGTLTTKQLRDNLNVLYVAGQENPQLLMISSLYLLGKYPTIQEKLRQEIKACNISDASTTDWRCLPYLTATILECLRLLPPISQLINRRAAEPVWLGGSIYISRGTYIGYNSYATNRDPDSWGPDADELRPERWGTTDEQISMKYRSAKARAEFISFHGGSRACLGEKFALLEMRVTLFVLVKTLRWELDPEWNEKITPVCDSASPPLYNAYHKLTLQAGPLYPRGVRLIFEKL
ncbi:unnamed protein product [Penicillium egyptiacum]|uniref:Cytochrome P450 n=1 Tax=Penicillium egyptiacum TaxID=1303716 RepID=A0A9W4KLQ6_9EURO|nr:unnamed protein product [Penicillium egyptiacum]